jgi:hypothetical protein
VFFFFCFSTKQNESASTDYVPPIRRPRTSEDFYMFCQLILEHENYEPVRSKADPTAIKPEMPPLDNKKEVHKVEDMEIEDMNIKQDHVIEQKVGYYYKYLKCVVKN